VRLVYFASVRESVGVSSEDYTLPSDVKTVVDLIKHMQARGDTYAAAFKETLMLRVAVNQTHALPHHAVCNNDEVAFFPPVTGG
jgi:sulfur-carrier protein